MGGARPVLAAAVFLKNYRVVVMLCILALYSVSAHKNVGIRKFSVLVASISAKSQFLMIFDSVLSFLYINVRDFWSAWLPSCSALKTAPICKISEKSASIRGIFSKICGFVLNLYTLT